MVPFVEAQILIRIPLNSSGTRIWALWESRPTACIPGIRAVFPRIGSVPDFPTIPGIATSVVGFQNDRLRIRHRVEIQSLE